MKTLSIIFIALVLASCVAHAPLPTPPEGVGLDSVLRCQDSHSLCLQGCSDMWGGRQDRCFDTCNEKLSQCYELTEKTAKYPGTHTE